MDRAPSRGEWQGSWHLSAVGGASRAGDVYTADPGSFHAQDHTSLLWNQLSQKIDALRDPDARAQLRIAYTSRYVPHAELETQMAAGLDLLKRIKHRNRSIDRIIARPTTVPRHAQPRSPTRATSARVSHSGLETIYKSLARGGGPAGRVVSARTAARYQL